jgi:DNA-binding transcriptional LysR family regulator
VFATLPDELSGVEAHELLRDPFVLLAPAGSALARQAPVPLSALHDLPLIRLDGCSRQTLIDTFLRAHGIEPRVVFESEDNGVVQSFVAAGVGCALVPRLTMDPLMPATRLLEIADAPPARRVGLVWSRDRLLDRTASAFVAAAVEALPETPAERGPAIRA